MPDYLKDCMEDLGRKLKTQIRLQDFTGTFCVRCKQPKCTRAGWANDKFSQRVQTQEERLFNPDRADPNAPKYAHLADFVDMTKEALKLEIASRRNDWTVPEEWTEVPVEDGVPQRSSSSQVDEAVRALRGGREPDRFVEEEEHEETDEVLEDTLTSHGEENLPKDPPKPKDPNKAVPPPKKRPPRDSGGVMLDGSAPPEKPRQQIRDPWAVVPGSKKVGSGATIKFGQDGKINE